MDRAELITLESVQHKTDNLLQQVPDGATTREIFCSVKSITRSEWAATATKGLKPAYCVTIWADEYEGEEVAILNGVRYSIYRTYQPNSDDMELYLERRFGA